MKKQFGLVGLLLCPVGALAQSLTNPSAVSIATGVATTNVLAPLASTAVSLSPAVTTYFTQLAMTAIAITVPMAVAGIKLYFPKLEKSYSHVFPIFAIALGGLFTLAANALTNSHVPGLLGILVGAAGIGVREIYDQTKQLWPTAPSLTQTTYTGGSTSGPTATYHFTGPEPLSPFNAPAVVPAVVPVISPIPTPAPLIGLVPPAPLPVSTGGTSGPNSNPAPTTT